LRKKLIKKRLMMKFMASMKHSAIKLFEGGNWRRRRCVKT
jgi:hypothetical protein